jgi:hypothetical protein
MDTNASWALPNKLIQVAELQKHPLNLFFGGAAAEKEI